MGCLVWDISLTGNHERAWNDPPVFAYQPGNGPPKGDEATSGTSTTKKLNKRVAFPLSASDSKSPQQASSSTVGLLPPMLPPPGDCQYSQHCNDVVLIISFFSAATGIPALPVIPTPPDQKYSGTTPTEPNNFEANESNVEVELDMVSTILNSKTLELKLENPGKLEDVNKRLRALYSSWKDGKLNSDIRRRMTRLCNSLEQGDLVQAEAIQVSLAVDYTAECSGWIIALKFIITQSKARSS